MKPKISWNTRPWFLSSAFLVYEWFKFVTHCGKLCFKSQIKTSQAKVRSETIFGEKESRRQFGFFGLHSTPPFHKQALEPDLTYENCKNPSMNEAQVWSEFLSTIGGGVVPTDEATLMCKKWKNYLLALWHKRVVSGKQNHYAPF